MKKAIFWAMLILVVIVSVVRIKTLKKPFNVEDYIIAKSTNSEISATFKPVLLYSQRGDGKVYMAGSGSVIKAGSESYIITSEHIFAREFGLQKVYVRYLRPFEYGIKESQGLSEIVATGSQMSDSPYLACRDIVMFKAGPAKPIQSFSKHAGGMNEPTLDLQPITDGMEIVSLVSGEKCKVFAESSNNHGSRIFIIGYKNYPGESGTGFLDKDGMLYVLKGSLEGAEVMSGEGMKSLEGAVKTTPMSLVIGPLALKLQSP
jgi:hypothetical protein